MARRLLFALLIAFVAACAAPGTSPSVEPSASPSGTASASPSPSPSDVVPSPTPTASAPASPTASPSPSPSPAETMNVRAYFFLADSAGGSPALVPVLRTIPQTRATARAAMTMLLAGPTAAERAADPAIGTMIPADTALLDIGIKDGLATVDLSPAFASGGGSLSVQGRLAQVVYTLTQFPTVTTVAFELGGKPVTVFSAEGVVLDEPLGREDFQEGFLPPIFVDRPAWGAGLPYPARVTGLSNVFEATFRVALLDHAGRVLVDEQAMATCGTGCWGTFDVTLRYDLSTAQWGTLRVWDYSARDGSVENLREYPVYLYPEA